MNWERALKKLFLTENYLYRLFAIIVILILLGVALRNWFEYQALKEEMSHTAYHEAKSLHEYFNSVRRVFHEQFIKSGIELNHDTVGFLPAHAASLISDDFQRHTSQGMLVRNVSDRNRNANNAPHPYERDAIEYFREHKNATELFYEMPKHQGNGYFYAAPLKIEAYCLMCHGKREDAPAFIRETYSTGYDYELGDVRGITSITVEKKHLLVLMNERYKYRMIFSSMIVVVIIGLIFLIVRRARKIEIRMINELEKLSFSDPLTNLCNRRKANEWIETYHHLFERYKEPYALIMVDIDHFKEVNDVYGHPMGDDVLKTFAQILKKNTREVDHVVRWGGEEFMIILPKTTLKQALIRAEAIRHSISIHEFGSIGYKTASLGVAQVHKGESIASLIERVDLSLYHAKENGRNRVSSEMNFNEGIK